MYVKTSVEITIRVLSLPGDSFSLCQQTSKVITKSEYEMMVPVRLPFLFTSFNYQL